jgi:3',5'-nucleoside bisphosphate phosphatase
LRWYKADLHIHSVLSPCGGLDMSPKNVIREAKKQQLDIIAITDHNSMANYQTYAAVAKKNDITVLCGMEIQTAEEIHVIALFDDISKAKELSGFLYESLLAIENDPEFFGDQVLLDEEENILGFEPKALINSSVWTFDEVIEKCHSFGGFVFPAHVDAAAFSVIGQLGFVPEKKELTACGVTAKCNLHSLFKQYPYLQNYAIIKNSDAHYPKDIGSGFTKFLLDEPTVKDIKKACLDKKNKIKYE